MIERYDPLTFAILLQDLAELFTKSASAGLKDGDMLGTRGKIILFLQFFCHTGNTRYVSDRA
jgi:hypothetical protein